MKLPFVSREHYEYMLAKLEADVARERQNFQRTLDYILERSAGSRLFDDVTRRIQPATPSGYLAVQESSAHKSARERIRAIQEDINTAQDEARDDNPEASALIEQTKAEGRKAADKK
jgi:hypothetical protein